MRIPFPADVIKAVPDPILDRYMELRKKFREIDEDRFVKLVAEVGKIADTPGMEFLQYLICDRIIYWRQTIEAGISDPRRLDEENGKIKALTHFVWNLPGKMMAKAKEITDREQKKNVASGRKGNKRPISVDKSGDE